MRYLLNGPAHLVKNVAGALRSPCRTIYVGRYFVDLASALDLQMPPPAFIGYDGQSDREALTFLNSTLSVTNGTEHVGHILIMLMIEGKHLATRVL